MVAQRVLTSYATNDKRPNFLYNTFAMQVRGVVVKDGRYIEAVGFRYGRPILNVASPLYRMALPQRKIQQWLKVDGKRLDEAILHLQMGTD